MRSARRAEVFESVPGNWSHYGATRSLYVSTLPVFSYCTGMYMNFRDDRGERR